jgi:hypothetical protein
MTLRSDGFPAGIEDTLGDLALDVAIAGRTSVAVLISASQESAMRLASTIAGSTYDGDLGSFVVMEAADVKELASFVTNAEAAGGHHLKTVVVRGIEAIDKAQQHVLIAMLAAYWRTPAPRPWRLITTTSVPLYALVVAGAFESRLFQYLNTIHITM